MDTPIHYSHASMSDVPSNEQLYQQLTPQSNDPSINQPADADMLQIYSELIESTTICSKYGLMFSAQFAAELATQMNFQPDEQTLPQPVTQINQPRVNRPLFATPATPDASGNQSNNQTSNQFSSPVTDPRVLLAKSYFDLREYAQCAHSLEHLAINQSNPQSIKRDSHAHFLYMYSIYLSGEQKCVEKKREISGSFGPGLAQLDAHQSVKQSINQSIPLIRSTFDHLIAQGCSLDPFECYLYALIEYNQSFHQSNNQITKQKAIDWLLQSLNQFPLNWSAWLLLSKLLMNSAELHAIIDRLPGHFMRSFFFLHFFIVVIHHENSHEATLLELFDKLFLFFPRSKTLLFLEAVYHHHQSNYDESAHLFAAVYKMFPDSMQYRDLYSNILYIKEDHVGLSLLAHDCIKRSKYTEESCIVFGNYYSLKRQHEKALSYFQRAFMLNPSYHWALTLMGHELVELQNLSAAIAVYRRALDCDERDYRAWYACGQAYENLMLPRMALYYYTRARCLRPYDARMWVAEAECYDKCGMKDESLACFEQAVECDDQQGTALNKLASLLVSRGEKELAARRYMQLLHRIEQQQQLANPNHQTNPEDPFFMPGGIPPEGIEAVTFLAGYYLSLGDLASAEAFCQCLMECGGPEKNHAMAWQQEIHKKRTEAANLLASTSALTTPTNAQLNATSPSQSASQTQFTPSRPVLQTRGFFDTPQS